MDSGCYCYFFFATGYVHAITLQEIRNAIHSGFAFFCKGRWGLSTGRCIIAIARAEEHHVRNGLPGGILFDPVFLLLWGWREPPTKSSGHTRSILAGCVWCEQ